MKNKIWIIGASVVAMVLLFSSCSALAKVESLEMASHIQESLSGELSVGTLRIDSMHNNFATEQSNLTKDVIRTIENKEQYTQLITQLVEHTPTLTESTWEGGNAAFIATEKNEEVVYSGIYIIYFTDAAFLVPFEGSHFVVPKAPDNQNPEKEHLYVKGNFVVSFDGTAIDSADQIIAAVDSFVLK